MVASRHTHIHTGKRIVKMERENVDHHTTTIELTYIWKATVGGERGLTRVSGALEEVHCDS